MGIKQPGFIEAFQRDVELADNATFHDGEGASTHTAVTSWQSFCSALGVQCLRPLDPITSSLSAKLSEMDLVKAWAFWRVKQCGTSPPTVRGYLSILNSWHHRKTDVGLAGNLSHRPVLRYLDGLSILQGAPPPRKLRVGVRPRDLRAGIDVVYDPASPADVNLASAMETGHGGCLRACEYVRGARKKFDPERGSASRADVSFEFDAGGEPVSCCVMAVNSKARGAERFRKLPHYLPMDAGYLSPGRMLYFLTEVADRVPLDQRRVTPLFRDPSTCQQITIATLRSEVKRVMQAAGRPPSAYGTHSLRIGQATARAFVGADEKDIKYAGKWSSAAYLKYVRERRAESLRIAKLACGADVDDFENEFLAIEQDPVSMAMADSSDED